ncbi:hypothetical protein [Microcoleus sp. herbarium14]|uniref:hypothetical protein n=1 Tax=Microcoleus sp. herbarium14 TaxID=3055439 RepID=UPI002FD2C3E9
MFESPTAKDRDNRRAIDCRRRDCKYLYLGLVLGIHGSILRSIARQTPEIDGTMNFHLSVDSCQLTVDSY